jgi:hypothetical protein
MRSPQKLVRFVHSLHLAKVAPAVRVRVKSRAPVRKAQRGRRERLGERKQSQSFVARHGC